MTERTDTFVWRWVEGAAAVLVFAFFLVATRELLNPFLLFVLLWAVLIPFRGMRGHTALVTISALVTFFWLLSYAGSVLAPFILAITLAYMLDPLVDRLERRWLSRNIAMAILTVFSVALLATALIVAVPAGIRQLGDVVQDLPLLVQRLVAWVQRLGQGRLAANVPVVAELVDRVQRIDANAIVRFLQERQEALGASILGGALGLGRGMRTVFTILGYGLLTPILTFYLLRDWDMIMGVVAGLIPGDRRETFVAFGRQCDQMISRYLHGQVTVALILGTLTWIGLAVARFPHAGLLALIVAVFNVVPYLGLVLSLIPAVVIALVSGSIATSLLKVAVVYGVTQILDGSVISPRVVGNSVGIHPVSVVLALTLGGFFFGFVGLLIGVPLASLIKLLLMRGIARYQESSLYRGSQAAKSAVS